jgi:hypothetical protein
MYARRLGEGQSDASKRLDLDRTGRRSQAFQPEGVLLETKLRFAQRAGRDPPLVGE